MTYLEKKIVKSNEDMDNVELLNWSMNQLFRASRTIDVLARGPGKNIIASACDITATVILRRLVRSKRGYKLINNTNPKLLRGYKKP